MDEEKWSDITIGEINKFIDRQKMTTPFLQEAMRYLSNPGPQRGSDVRIELTDPTGKSHILLIEIQLYASGTPLEGTIKRWATRHTAQENTTTIVLSMLFQMMRRRLLETDQGKKMATAPNFRIFPARGDGTLSDEAAAFIVRWIERRLNP